MSPISKMTENKRRVKPLILQNMLSAYIDF